MLLLFPRVKRPEVVGGGQKKLAWRDGIFTRRARALARAWTVIPGTFIRAIIQRYTRLIFFISFKGPFAGLLYTPTV